jgi:flagellar hook-associated protein 2
MSQNLVNLLGAGTGIDTQALVKSLVEVERSAPQERIDTQRETAETRISDLGLLNSALSSLQDAAAALGNTDVFNTKSAVIGDSTAFSAVSLGTEAPVGDFSFTISQLAQAQSLSTQTVFSSTTDAVGKGTLTFNFGSYTTPGDATTFSANTTSAEQTITIDDSNNTLAGLARTINNADFGVQASIVNDGTGPRLVFRAESGLNNQLQITAADDDGINTDASGLSRFAYNADTQQLAQNQVGRDSAFAVNGLAVSRSSNTIDDVIDGFEFNLSGLTAVGEAVNVTIEQDTNTAVNTVRDFVEIYNTFIEAIEPLIGVNPETNERGSLAGDSLARNLPVQVRQLLLGDVGGLDSTFTALTNIGVRTQRDGTLSIDETDFDRAINNNFDAFRELFIPVTQGSTDQITVNKFGDNTQSGVYDVVITQPPVKGNLEGASITASGGNILDNLAAATATNATLTGTAPTAALSDFAPSSGAFVGGASTLTLDLAKQGAGATDFDFSITVDGIASAANISLPVADYASNDDVATALQTAINNDANLSGVIVSFASGQFSFTSSTTGAASAVALTAVGVRADELGMDTGAATAGTGGANDYDFSIDVDGITSGTISITPGTFASFDELATELQTQINADATLSGSGASVGVSYNGSEFVITSNATGIASTIDNIALIGSEAVGLGLNAGTAVQGAATGGNTSDYDFSISLNGTASGIISIDAAAYADFDELAAEMEAQINADSALLAVGASVNVSYDSVNNIFDIQSSRYGSASNVVITNVGANANDLGLAAGTSTAGINVAGTIDGVAAFGTGNVLLPALGQPGESLALLIGENATSGTINFSRGLGGALEALITQFLGSSGAIALRETSLNSDLDDLDTDQLRLDSRIEAYQERLSAKFIASEAIIRSLQRSGDFLVTTLDNLLNAGRDN